MARKERLDWKSISSLPSKSYTCGYCGSPLASEKGYLGERSSGGGRAFIYVCHFCHRPTFFDLEREQSPGAPYGGTVQHIPDVSTAALYDEARNAMAVSSYTGAVLCCRKLLMHIAVAKGAKPGQSFISYVEHLADNNFVPPDAKDWVDHIRAKGNEANHEIAIMSREDAEDLLSFSEMLLKLIFEFPATIKTRTAPAEGPESAD
jgi:hypothetical protein